MTISVDHYEAIRSLDVDEHKTSCDWHRWEAKFEGNGLIAPLIVQCKSYLKEEFGRADIVGFYQLKGVPEEAKFLAAMIWGHEAPAGSRPDRRGPWKVAQMFSDAQATVHLLRNLPIGTGPELRNAYRRGLSLKRCGPNFFTKHLYFLGKSKGQRRPPLIFDDRVAAGIVKLTAQSATSLELVTVHAKPKVDAYLKYLAFAHAEADKIGCAPDQIEYFLFRL
jgi:hypothetical protein